MKIINYSAEDNLSYSLRQIRANNNYIISIGVASLFSLTKTGDFTQRRLSVNELDSVIDNVIGRDVFWDSQIPKGIGEFLVTGEAHFTNSANSGGVSVKVGDVSKLLIVDKANSSKVVGFEPYPINCPQRRLPDTIDFTQKILTIPNGVALEYFNTAPFDQRVDGFFNGDEKIEIKNMHPNQPIINSLLPGQRLRMFIIHKNDRGEDGFREIPAQADTLWLLPNMECGVLIYRAICPVLSQDASDIKYAYTVVEDLNAEEKSMDDYLPELFAAIKSIDAATDSGQNSPVSYVELNTVSDNQPLDIVDSDAHGAKQSLEGDGKDNIQFSEDAIIENFKDVWANDPELEKSLREKMQAIKNIRLQLEQLQQQAGLLNNTKDKVE